MTISRRTLLGSATAAAAIPFTRVRAQTAPTLKIGVLNDMSGPYMNLGGPTSVVCTKQALEDFGVSAKGLNVDEGGERRSPEQTRPGLVDRPRMVRSRRRGRGDRRADIVRGTRRDGCGTREEQDLPVLAGVQSDLTGKTCSPNFIHWTYDTYMLAKSTGGAMVKAGGDSWFFLTADYAFGKQLQADTTSFVQGARAARSSAPRLIHFPAPQTSRRSWCRRSRARPRCWGSPTPAPTR